MKVLSGDGNVEGWRGAEKRKKLRRSEKGRGESRAVDNVDHANYLNKCNIDVS